ncbi:MAG: FAD-binding oxidoreductase [Ignavibacteria bacterium]|nr:FAD-binding oxidoreductase [Ignavibacteria bacterium]
MLSFWEKNSFLNYDVIIIGSGILGLSVASEISEKFPDKKILILEKGILPTGASTKNAGFACFGSLTEILSDFKTKGEDETLKLVYDRLKGIEILRERLTDEKTGYENYGGYELITEKEISALNEIDSINEKLKNIIGENVFETANDKIPEFGFDAGKVKSLVYSKYESQVDTGELMKNYIRYVQERGITILTGCEVKEVNIKNSKPEVVVSHNVFHEDLIFQSGKVVICANAFSSKIFSDIKVKPGRGQVLITKPIEGLRLKGVFHYDEGFYYFRNYKNRIIFGGGRNLDFENEESYQFRYNFKIIDDLENKLINMILPAEEFEVDMIWTGIMGFTENKLPEIKDIEGKIISAISCNGMGVALSGYLAKKVIKKYF